MHRERLPPAGGGVQVVFADMCQISVHSSVFTAWCRGTMEQGGTIGKPRYKVLPKVLNIQAANLLYFNYFWRTFIRCFATSEGRRHFGKGKFLILNVKNTCAHFVRTRNAYFTETICKINFALVSPPYATA